MTSSPDDAPPTAAELWARIDPAALTTDQLLLWELNHSVGELRTDVRSERRGRRLSIVELGVAIVVAVLVGGMFATQVERDRQQACATRVQSRSEVRALAVAIVDEVTKPPAQISATAKTELLERARRRAIEELPPPDC